MPSVHHTGSLYSLYLSLFLAITQRKPSCTVPVQWRTNSKKLVQLQISQRRLAHAKKTLRWNNNVTFKGGHTMVTVYVALAQKEQRAVPCLSGLSLRSWREEPHWQQSKTRYHIPGKIFPIIHIHYGKYNSYWLGIFLTTIQYSSTCTSLWMTIVSLYLTPHLGQ